MSWPSAWDASAGVRAAIAWARAREVFSKTSRSCVAYPLTVSTRFGTRSWRRLSHPGFYRRVLRATAKVPFGEMITYSDAAKRAGSPRAFRAAWSALGSNPIPIVVPCHRVVRTGGDIGNYGGGPEMKRFLLELENAL